MRVGTNPTDERITSGLPVIQTQWDKNSYKQAQIVVVGSLREKHQGLSI